MNERRFTVWAAWSLPGVAALLVAALSGCGEGKPIHPGEWSFTMKADVTTATMPDGKKVVMWGFGMEEDNEVSVPGPVLTVPRGVSKLTIHLRNNLTQSRTGVKGGVPVSIVIPGQIGDMTPVRWGAQPYPEYEGRVRSLTAETPPDGRTMVSYVWTDLKPGTYMYHSGTHIQLQIQMGLFGGMTNDVSRGQAYPGIGHQRETALFFHEVDPAIHEAASSDDFGPGKSVTSMLNYRPRYFLINGKAHGRRMTPINVGRIGETVLLRLFNAGSFPHSPAVYGTRPAIIAEDGCAYPYPVHQYSILMEPGKTRDVLVSFPERGLYPLYDNAMGLTYGADGEGGMIAHLKVD